MVYNGPGTGAVPVSEPPGPKLRPWRTALASGVAEGDVPAATFGTQNVPAALPPLVFVENGTL